MNEQKFFSIKATQVVKGIAIIAMLIHHSIDNNPGLSIAFSLSNIKTIIAASFKVCVCLFTILSGFGITMSWKKKGHHKLFVRNHIIKLWFSFIFIYIFYIITMMLTGKSIIGIYGQEPISILYFIKDVMGLQNLFISTPTLSGVWWYMETIFVCYLLFPLFYKIISKSKKRSFILLTILYLPWIFYFILKGWDWHTDREIFYLCSFCIGIFCAEHKIFDKFVEISCKKNIASIIFSIFLLALMFVIRSKLCLVVDSLFALSIIIFCICVLNKLPIISDFFANMGECSADIYMFHCIIKELIVKLGFSRTIYEILTLIFICWGVALVLNKLKIILKYDKLVNKFIK